MAKYGMSMCVLGMSEEFKPLSIAVNALWPRTGELNKLIRICYIEELLNMRNSCSLKQNCFFKEKNNCYCIRKHTCMYIVHMFLYPKI